MHVIGLQAFKGFVSKLSGPEVNDVMEEDAADEDASPSHAAARALQTAQLRAFSRSFAAESVHLSDTLVHDVVTQGVVSEDVRHALLGPLGML